MLRNLGSGKAGRVRPGFRPPLVTSRWSRLQRHTRLPQRALSVADELVAKWAARQLGAHMRPG
jgi:hypothetical protein